MSFAKRAARPIAILGVFVPAFCFAAAPLKHDIRGAALGMSLGEAMDALAGNGGVCGKGVFDTHRCDFDADTWVHLHVAGLSKIVESIKYSYPPFNNPGRFLDFKTKVVDLFHLEPVDNAARYITPEGYLLTIVDGEIDLESATKPVPTPAPEVPEPKL